MVDYAHFEASNDLETNSLYFWRQYYRHQSRLLLANYPNYIDLWYREPYYGKVDTAGNLIMPSQVSLKYSNRDQLVLVAPVFDAFEDFRDNITKGSTLGKTSLRDVFGNFVAKKSFEDPLRKYMNYAYSIVEQFNKSMSIAGRLVPNLEVYTKAFVDYLSRLTNVFTFSSYYASNKVSVNSSGLSVELLDLDHGDDYAKNKVWSHPDFMKYVKRAAAYGFRINKNAPWQLIADLGSKAMQRYLLKPEYTAPSIDTFFFLFFEDVSNKDIVLMNVLLTEGYKTYSDKRRWEVKTAHCVKPSFTQKSAIFMDVTSTTKQYFLEDISYDDANLLSSFGLLYLEKIKQKEFKKRITHKEYDFFKVKFLSYLKMGDYHNARIILESFYDPVAIYSNSLARAPHYFEESSPYRTKELTLDKGSANLYKSPISAQNLPNGGGMGY